jgi:CO/xanthine dehydrogenase FAD-binding subunit
MSGIWYHPREAAEAAALAERFGPQGLLVAGATDILPNMRNKNLIGGFPWPGLTGYEAYIDLSSVEALKQIEVSDGLLKIGSAVTHQRLASDPLIKIHAPLLAVAAGLVGSPQVRNRGTVGGNIITLASCADTLPALAAHDAILNFYQAKAKGETFRRISLDEYLTKPSQRYAHGEELLFDISVPLSRGNWRYHFEKIARREAAAKSRISLACGAELAGGIIKDARIALGAVTAAPRRYQAAETLLTGKRPEPALFAMAGDALVSAIVELSGQRSSFVYKLPVIKDLVIRCFSELFYDGPATGETQP